ncbi:MAG: hypothetical protein JWP29_5560 [Rhodoferax sp.]|nr:hypothetical protein [Rhodoferax sp.]
MRFSTDLVLPRPPPGQFTPPRGFERRGERLEISDIERQRFLSEPLTDQATPSTPTTPRPRRGTACPAAPSKNTSIFGAPVGRPTEGNLRAAFKRAATKAESKKKLAELHREYADQSISLYKSAFEAAIDSSVPVLKGTAGFGAKSALSAANLLSIAIPWAGKRIYNLCVGDQSETVPVISNVSPTSFPSSPPQNSDSSKFPEFSLVPRSSALVRSDSVIVSTREEWEAVRTRILNLQIDMGSSAPGTDPTSDQPITLLDVSKLLNEQLKLFLTTDLKKIIADEVSKVAPPPVPDLIGVRAAARELELDVLIRHAQDEKRLIKDKGWREPIVLPPVNAVNTNDVTRPLRPRFDPSVLPKYVHYQTNLQSWFADIQVEVNLFGEELVWAAIPRYCFTEGSVVKAWYVGLGDVTHNFVTKDRDCWSRFKTAMTRQWSLPVGIAVRKAEERRKKNEETFLEYFYAKLNLLKNAYPVCNSDGYIEMIKASFEDPNIDLWARETSDLAVFAAELRLYDDHLIRYPAKAHVSAPVVSRINTRFSYSSPSLDQKSAQTSSVKNTSVKLTADTKDPARPRKTNDEIISLNKRRVESIQKRRDENGKMVDSFVKDNGSIGFLKNACTVCAKNGSPDKWHFSFACPLNKLSGLKSAQVKAESMAARAEVDDDESSEIEYTESENDEGVLE